MDAKHCWGLSAAIHAVLLVGAAVTALNHFVLDYGEGSGFSTGEGAGFSCRLGDPTLRFDRIERPQDFLGSRIPSDDGPVVTEIYSRGGGDFVGEGRNRWSVCCECDCGGAATALAAWPRDIVSYVDRKLSMATSWRGAPRLRTHSRSCASQQTGLEDDCTCGLTPPRR